MAQAEQRWRGQAFHGPCVAARGGIRQPPWGEVRNRPRQFREQGLHLIERPGGHIDRSAFGDTRTGQGCGFHHLLYVGAVPFGLADNPKVAQASSIDDLNRPDVTIAYIIGSPQGAWLQKRLPKAVRRGVAGSLADVPIDEITSHRADVANIDKFFF